MKNNKQILKIILDLLTARATDNAIYFIETQEIDLTKLRSNVNSPIYHAISLGNLSFVTYCITRSPDIVFYECEQIGSILEHAKAAQAKYQDFPDERAIITIIINDAIIQSKQPRKTKKQPFGGGLINLEENEQELDNYMCNRPDTKPERRRLFPKENILKEEKKKPLKITFNFQAKKDSASKLTSGAKKLQEIPEHLLPIKKRKSFLA